MVQIHDSVTFIEKIPNRLFKKGKKGYDNGCMYLITLTNKGKR
jgi:hypothetical protein